jgi:hypothetical protein
MSWRFRKTRSFGPIRLVGAASVGFGPLRYSLGADGKVRRTTRLPDGSYKTEEINPDDAK